MEYTNLGSTGLKVSRICLGTIDLWLKKMARVDFGRGGKPAFHPRALQAGINFFDTADVYSLGASEEILGRALKDFAPSRDRVVIATKVFNAMGDDPNQRGLSRKHIHHAIDDKPEAARHRLRRSLPNSPLRSRYADEETLEALNRCRPRRKGALHRRNRRCMRGNSRRCSPSRTRIAGLGLPPCKTTTTSSTGRKSAR